MEIPKLLEMLFLLEKEKEKNTIEEKLLKLKDRKGDALFIRSEKDFGQNLLLRYTLSKSEIPCYYGRGLNQPLFSPYSLFVHEFSEFFQKFSQKSEQKISQAFDGLEHFLYKGSTGKITRRFTQKKGKSIQAEGIENSLFIEFAQFLEEKLPCVLYLEDIQNADLATLKLLIYLLDAFSGKPILFLFTGCPEMLDNPELPLELRGPNVPAIMQIQALQRSVRPKISGRDPRQMLQEIAQRMEILDFLPIDEKNCINIIKKLLNLRFSDRLLNRLLELTQGNLFSLCQTILYLSQNILFHNGKKWELKYAEEEIVLPVYLEEMLKQNLEDIPADCWKALQYAACFIGPLSWDLWQSTLDYSEEKWQEILQQSIQKGILQQYPDKNTLVFSNEKQREAILREIPLADKQEIHANWAICLQDRKLPSYFSLHYLKNSTEPQDSLNSFLQAGWNAELSGCYEESYEFYREAAKSFPELRDMLEEEKKGIVEVFHPTPQNPENTKKLSFQKIQASLSLFIQSNINKRKKQTIEGIKESLYRIISLYRMVALDEAEAIFNKEMQNIVRKMVYFYSPHTFFPLFGPLVLYLLKVCQWNKKAYPREDILFFFHLVTLDILPRKDYQNQIFFYQELQKASLIANVESKLYALYEKKAHRMRENHLLASINYLRASHYARQSKEYFHAARILHSNIQYINQNLEIPGMKQIEIESLRRLGMVYEKSAKEESQEEKKNLQANQSIAAYRDCVYMIWRKRDASWLAQSIIEHALELCEAYSFENDIILDLQKTARSKQAILSEQEYTGKILVLAGREEIGAVEILEEQILQEGFWPEIIQGSYDLSFDNLPQGYSALVLLSTYNSPDFKDAWKVLPAIVALGKRYSGYFIYENPQCPCFLLLGKDPFDVFHTAIEFSREKTMNAYL